MVKLITKTFRCDEKCERLAIKNARREKLGFSSYIRNLIYKKERIFTLPPKEISKLKAEYSKLSKIGSNLNQISHHINAKAKIQRNGDDNILQKEIIVLIDLIKNSNAELEQIKNLFSAICQKCKVK